jgi:hypothetical protein
MGSLQYRGRTYQRADGREVVIEARWTESRNGVALTVPYVWRAPRSRLAALTRSRVEAGLARDRVA